MATVTLQNIVKKYRDKTGEFLAVKSINLDIRDQEFMVLVGPSGCGKSTTLRMVAGLEEISDGSLYIDGKLINNIAPKDRDIAMVFQNYALYPHMSVYDNMAFGLKLMKYPKTEIKKRVMDASSILGLDALLDRKPKALSGGQRQRVALGRAIVRKPKVFLFDEPLSNLDAKMRVQMRAEIAKLHANVKTTMIYVTHDQIEAMTMGDRITVMKDGNIMQVDEPIQLYNHPANMFVAGFIGSPAMNFIRGKVEKQGEKTVFIEKNTKANPFKLTFVDELAKRATPYLGREVVLGIRPENLENCTHSGTNSPETSFETNVDFSEPIGAETYLYLNTGEHPIIARVDTTVRIAINEKILLGVDLKKVHLFDPETEKVIL